MSTVLEVVYRNGQVELPPGVQIAENTRALLLLPGESERREEAAPTVQAAERTAAWQRLRGIAAPSDSPPPADEEIREMYTDYLVEKYR
jgi:hypothetical protein